MCGVSQLYVFESLLANCRTQWLTRPFLGGEGRGAEGKPNEKSGANRTAAEKPREI